MPLVEPFSALTAALRKANLIPDILPDSFTPSAFLQVTLPSTGAAVDLGAEVPIAQTAEEPQIGIVAVPNEADIGEDGLVKPSIESPTRYTLAMVDPDAPSAAQPVNKHWRHWLITGLTASEDPLLPALQSTATTICPYRPPAPPKGSGLHRYSFVLFREPTSGNFSIPADAPERETTVVGRRHWDPVKFAETYDLEIVGATYYLVRSEE
ncbi:PEBP-like protein [Mycena amicta]|nr:PEBP-like protein [Mycena amicta]